MDTDTHKPTLAGRREWLGLATLALPTILLALDSSVLYLALPHLSADLDAGSTQQLWIMDIYGFMIAGFLVTMGTLGDRVGRRRLLMIGAALFAVASVLVAFSTSAEMLIVTRALLGIVAATLMPSTLALLVTMFQDPRQRGVAIGIWLMCFMGGSAIGPVIGGVLLENFWWGSVFLMGVPVMVVLLIAAPLLLPEFRNPQAGKLDPASVLLSLLTVLPIVYGLKEIAKDGFVPVPIVALVVGLLFGVLFVRRQLTLPSPLLDLSLFRSRSFTGALLVMLFGIMTVGGSTLLFATYLQEVTELSPFESGLWLLVPAVAQIIGVLIATKLAKKTKPSTIIMGGLVVSVIGFILLAQIGPVDGFAIGVVGLAVAFLGGAPVGALGMGLIVGSAPPEKAGQASSISETNLDFGMAMGVALMGSVGVAVYRNDLADTMPAGLSTEAIGTAMNTLAGARSAAAELPGTPGDSLLVAAREAFANGVSTASIAAAAICVVLVFVTGVMLKMVAPTGAAAAEPEATAPEEESRTPLTT
jgi:DHA2 family multidrug resistance protein-like MFS transporter